MMSPTGSAIATSSRPLYDGLAAGLPNSDGAGVLHPSGLGDQVPLWVGGVEWPVPEPDEQEIHVNKTELRDAIASHAELSNAQADKALEAVITSITQAVAGGDK